LIASAQELSRLLIALMLGGMIATGRALASVVNLEWPEVRHKAIRSACALPVGLHEQVSQRK